MRYYMFGEILGSLYMVPLCRTPFSARYYDLTAVLNYQWGTKILMRYFIFSEVLGSGSGTTFSVRY